MKPSILFRISSILLLSAAPLVAQAPAPTGAPLVLFNREIAVLRAPFGGLAAEERVAAIERRLALAGFARAALGALPGFGMVVLIFLIARYVARLSGAFFERVERGTVSVAWLDPETARATRRIFGVLIWFFAIAVAYPLVPGSSSDAFKGLSVFVGVVASLGSAGVANQIMSGLVVIYSRAIQTGDYVRIGEHEGVVAELGVLSTKLLTRRKEEISIPNALLVGTATLNWSRRAGSEGAIAATSVTIGYDAPWRQVHALLLLAAERTPGVKPAPRPLVLQKALSDFFVEYQLLVHIERPQDRIPILSELHAQIQDAFNEYGVQIMSPHFEAQPDRQIVVPKMQWTAAPAGRPDAQPSRERAP